MNSNKKTTGIDMKALLSTSWIFVLLNVIFRDIHELFRPELLKEMMAGTVNGVHITEELLLLGGIGMEILIAMVILSRILPYRVNRWANIIVGPISIPLLLSSGIHDLDDMFFFAIEIVALLLITWLAWKWPKQEHESIPSVI